MFFGWKSGKIDFSFLFSIIFHLYIIKIDAVLLGTKRIGHGFSLVKYPNILKIVKKLKIGIEVNPISNQVLKLVDDLRNHPAAILFSDDYPVVISRYVAHIIDNRIFLELFVLVLAMILRSGVHFHWLTTSTLLSLELWAKDKTWGHSKKLF